MTINSFRDLRVWQAGMKLVVAVVLDFTDAESAQPTLELSTSLSRQVYALRNAIARKIEEGR